MAGKTTVPTSGEPAAAGAADVGELVRRCRAGDQAAWEALIARYAGLINGVAVRYGLSEYDCADVFQNVCVELWRNLGTIREPERLPGWLVTVTGRTCLQHLRRRYARQGAALTETDVATLVDQSMLPEERSLLAEQWSALARAVGELDGRCRALVWGLFFDPAQPSYEELGRRLGMPKDSIGPVRLRCLARLRRALEGREMAGS